MLVVEPGTLYADAGGTPTPGPVMHGSHAGAGGGQYGAGSGTGAGSDLRKQLQQPQPTVEPIIATRATNDIHFMVPSPGTNCAKEAMRYETMRHNKPRGKRGWKSASRFRVGWRKV